MIYGGASDDDSVRAELRALDPDADELAPARFEGAVMSQIAASSVTPLVPTDPLFGLWSLPRSVLVAASIFAIAILGISVAQRPRARRAPATIAESMGVPPQLLSTGPSR